MDEKEENTGFGRADALFSFFERLKTMSDIRRFGTHPMIGLETVAGHSYNVAIIALLISDFEEGLEIDREVLVRKALFHDFEETLLSDIPHPIKHRFKGGKLGMLLKQIVPELIEEEIFKELPSPVRERYIRHAKEAKEGVEGRIIKAADAMDIVITSLREIRMGNRYFEKIFEKGLILLGQQSEFRFARMFMESARDYREKGHAGQMPDASDW